MRVSSKGEGFLLEMPRLCVTGCEEGQIGRPAWAVLVLMRVDLGLAGLVLAEQTTVAAVARTRTKWSEQ